MSCELWAIGCELWTVGCGLGAINFKLCACEMMRVSSVVCVRDDEARG